MAEQTATGPTTTDAPGTSSVDRVVAALEAAGERVVLVHPDGETTGAELLAAVRRYARALDGLGIVPGDLVAQYAPNRPDALAVRYATHLIGAAAVYLSAPPGADRRARQLEQIDPRLVVVFPRTAQWLPVTTAPVAAVGSVEGVPLRLDELAAGQSTEPFASRSRPGDLGTVLSSGGTTGIPKASIRDVAAWAAAVATPPRPERRQLASGAEAYLTQILVAQTLIGGGTVVLRDDSEPAALLEAIESERITDLFLVEPQLAALIDHPDVGRRDLSSLRTLTHIGASAPPALRRRAYERLGPVLQHTYGASEMGIVSALRPEEYDPTDPARATSAGRILPGVEVRFRAADGRLDPASGSMEVRSAAMAHGYRNRPEEQAEHFVDGWYRTGDLGRLDPDGLLHVLGRAADCAVVDGRLVTPTGIEDVLMGLPSVRYAVVVADLAHHRRVAAVLPPTDRESDPAACRAAVEAEYGAGVAAGLVVVPMTDLPLTEQGKPDRAAVLAAASTREEDAGA
ncbi:class I adenylate-forming enzyme family protein [Actinomycetospora corticicola]|uniref:Fatty-acyl-CoA synthase n=1 Tax=Actinomycetospora corticicola TaxID=663602 RepID=A0A7Y9DW22_9PSEU|nr:AMP-binding protein [Actinomycetospora corticicola]NYD36491.1 fatty-acyl-CoA synthase [Actinomycetospora corticicola]